MAILGIPNLCGANLNQENLLNKINEIADNVVANLDSDASTTAAAVQGKLDEGLAELKKLVPEIPSVPSTNLQAEITSLLALTPTSLTYAASLAKITADFGDAITKKGLSLDTLLKDGLAKIAAGGDVCCLVPNLEIASGSTEVTESAGTAGQADTAPIEEEASVIETAGVAVAAANAALETRKDDVASLAKTALKKIAIEIGTVDRMSGTMTPVTKTKLREMDAEVSAQKAKKGMGAPADVAEKNHTAAVSNLEPKSVTGADTGAGTVSTNEASTPAVDLKKKLLNDFDTTYQKFRDDSKMVEFIAITKASQRGYPHNIVPDTNKSKMYVWPVDHSKRNPKDQAPELQVKKPVEVPKGSGIVYRKSFLDAYMWSIKLARVRKDAYYRWKLHIEKTSAVPGYDLTSMIETHATFKRRCEDNAKDIAAHFDFMFPMMIKPVKVPEEETKTEVVATNPPPSDAKENASRSSETKAEAIARFEQRYADYDLEKIEFIKNYRGRRMAKVILTSEYDNQQAVGLGINDDGAVNNAINSGKRKWRDKQSTD